MLGAIIGDIVGSVYEWHNIKTKDFPLFRDDCFFTDDTVMTIATADAIMNGGEVDNFIGDVTLRHDFPHHDKEGDRQEGEVVNPFDHLLDQCG